MSKNLKKGAKQVYFMNVDGNIVVKVKSVALNTVYAPEEANTGHGYIKIELLALEGLSRAGVLDKKTIRNIHYICTPKSDRNLRSNKVLVMCDNVSPETGAFQIMDNSEKQLKDRKSVV